MINVVYLGLFFFVFNTIDIFTTLYATLALGSAEQNPLMSKVLNQHVYAFVAVKLLVAFFSVWYLVAKNRRFTLWFSCILYHSVIIWNLAVIVVYTKIAHMLAL